MADRFTGPANAIQGSFNQLEGATDRLANKINDSLSKIGAGAAMIATGIGILAPLKKAMDVQSEFENYEIQLTTLLKSAEKAKGVLANIKKDAKDNPVFGTKELMVANTSLIATGEMDPERARSMVNNLAGAVAGVGKGNEELSRMSANLMQIATTGKATSMDIKQFGMAGIPIYRMLAESTGLSTEKLKEMDITLPMLEDAFAKASAKGGMFEGALARAAEGSVGLKAALEDNVIFTLKAIGKTLEPITKPLMRFFNDILSWIQDFAKTNFGKWVIIIGAVAMGLLALTLIIVGVIMVVEALSVAIGTVLIEVLPFILAIALIIGLLWLMYEAINSNNPLIIAFGAAIALALGPIGWIAFAIMFVVRCLNEFDAYMNSPLKFSAFTPIQQFFIRLGAIIRAIIEIFSNATDDGTTMSASLYKALQDMGLGPMVDSIGTWLIRIKSFLRGMYHGFIDAYHATKKFLGAVMDKLTPVLKATGVWDDHIGKNTSNVKKWAEAGKWAGIILFGALAILIGAFLVLAVVSLLAFLPAIIMAVLVVAAIWLIIEIILVVIACFKAWWEAVKFLAVLIPLVFAFIWQYISNWVSGMWQMGVDFVTNIWEGVQSKWGEFTAWLSGMWDSVTSSLGFGDAVGGDATVTTNSNMNFGKLNDKTAKVNTAGGGNNQFNSNVTNNKGIGSVAVPIYLDGEKIGNHIIDKQKLDKARD